jgi:hypothetical protein
LKSCEETKTWEGLETFFKVNQWPTKQQKANLAKQYNLNIGQVKVWFYHKRKEAKNRNRQSNKNTNESITASTAASNYLNDINEENENSSNFDFDDDYDDDSVDKTKTTNQNNISNYNSTENGSQLSISTSFNVQDQMSSSSPTNSIILCSPKREMN